MSAAVCQGQIATGSTASYANAETGFKFNLSDNQTDVTTPIQVPTATGTNYSYIKNLVLAVTTAGTTNISNRRINYSGSLSTGLTLWWKGVAVASYAQAASGNRPAAGGTNGATPTGYTAMTSSTAVYDSSSVASSSTGANGMLATCVMGVDNTYVGGAGNATALPSIQLTYDEA